MASSKMMEVFSKFDSKTHQRLHDTEYCSRMKSTSKPVAPFHDLRFVFLDRDGVVNRKPHEGKYISEWSDFEILPGVEEAIAKLNRHGCQVFVVSNQRGIALGLYSVEQVDRIHHNLQQHLAIHGARVDGFYYCPHDKGQCACRKPETGMFQQAVQDFPSATAKNSVMIGDSLSDIQAAEKLGCRSVFIEGDPSTRKPGSEMAEQLADGTAHSLLEAVNALLGQ